MNEYGNVIPLAALQFANRVVGENGFILNVETGVAREVVAHLSVAVHPRGVNFGQETLDFIDEDPLHNVGAVYDVMSWLTGGRALAIQAPQMSGRIVAGGSFQRVETPETQEYLDALYEELVAQFAAATGLPETIIRSQFPRSSMEQYLSGFAYQSAYAGGTEVTLSEFLDLYRDPANWQRLDFLVEARFEDTNIPGLYSVTSLSGNAYSEQLLPPVPAAATPVSAVPSDQVYADTDIRYTGIQPEYWWREVVRTHDADAFWPETGILAVLGLQHDAAVCVALDKRLTPPVWLADWTPTGESIVTTDEASSPMPVYRKDFAAGPVFLPGQGNAGCRMYIPFIDAGTFNLVVEVIGTSHAVLMADDPADVTSSTPATRQEGGVVVNANGIGTDAGTGYPLVHADFVQEFDANVLLGTETSEEASLAAVSPKWFVGSCLLLNNGFRLIDTYNDATPTFGAGSQVIQLENFLGNSLGSDPVRMVMDASELLVFTNFNILNSPNLVGICLKAIATDDPALAGQLWKTDPADKGLDLAALIPAVETATGFTFFYSNPGSPITLEALLRQTGISGEGELSFGVNVTLASGFTLELRGGLYCHDYWTNVYAPVLPDEFPLPFRRP